MILVYHSPKQHAGFRLTKEEAEEANMFMHSQDPSFDGSTGAYWFSPEYSTAVTHADYWRAADGG